MNRVLAPTHLRLRPMARAIFCGVLVLGGVVAWPSYAGDSIAANPAPVKRPLNLAAASNPCAANKTAGGAGNPCAAKNKVCGASNPCAAKNTVGGVSNPCAAKNTAGGASNPCAAKNAAGGASNPCAAKNAAGGASNPCAAKIKACGASNPCAAKRVTNPCAAKKGGGAKVSAKVFMRPCGAGVNPRKVGNLVKQGERLWKDSSLSGNGLACNTCDKKHAALNPTFAMTYPHQVAMPLKMAGVQQINVDEMIQFCMLVPMQAKILDWNSRELAALTAYTVEFQKAFKPGAAKKRTGADCAACHPCAATNKGASPSNPRAAKKQTH